MLIGTRARKEELIAQMGSDVRDVAVAASEELARHGWLSDGSLRGARLAHSDLHGANLVGADLQEADLFTANLQEADLEGANLQGANLREANLQRTILGVADLRRANLQGANLRRANLSTVCNLETAKLDGVIANSETKWPEDFDPGAHGVIVDRFFSVVADSAYKLSVV